MKTFWIVQSDVHAKIDLDDDKQADRYYKQIEKYCDKKQYDCLSIIQNGAEVLVVICPDGSIDAINNDKVVVNKGWRQDHDWDQWNDGIDFWDKVKRLDNFFKKTYRYVTLIKIVPESAIPEDSDDSDEFFERSACCTRTDFRGRIGDLVRMAKGIQTNPSVRSTPPPNPATSANSSVAAPPSKTPKQNRKSRNSCSHKEHEKKIKRFYGRLYAAVYGFVPPNCGFDARHLFNVRRAGVD